MTKTLKDAEKITAEKLRNLTPSQVDELFAVVWDFRYDLTMKLIQSHEGIFRASGAKKSSRGWPLTLTEAEHIAHKEAAEHPTGPCAKALDRNQEILREISTLDTGVLAKLEDEFARRGGWTRAYLVTDGHAHSSMGCSTCNNGEYPTRFSWMIDYSGKSEEEIVEAAGDRACSVCYPSAPVNRGRRAPASVLSTQEEKDRAVSREKLTARKQEIADKKAAKAIYDADGGPLTAYSWTQKAHQKRDRRGNLVDVPEREFFDTLATLHAARGWLADCFDGWRGGSDHRDLNKVADAVALKEGKDRDTVIAEAKKRAARRG